MFANQNGIKTLGNDQLINRTKEVVAEERGATAEVLRHFAEIERRRLYARRYGSLFEMAVKEFGYSEAAAGRRISAMPLMCDVPEVEQKIASGELALTNAALLQSFFRMERVEQKKSYTPEQKQELVEQVSGKSKRDCEKLLVSISPRSVRPEKERVLTPTKTEITFTADDELMGMLMRVKELISHVHPQADYQTVFKYLARLGIKTLTREVKPRHSASGVTCSHGSAPATNPRYLRPSLRSQVWKRDQGQCTHSDEPQNLRLLCRTHNAAHAIHMLGKARMTRHLRS